MKFVKKFLTEKAEKFCGKAAKLGMFALMRAYYFPVKFFLGSSKELSLLFFGA